MANSIVFPSTTPNLSLPLLFAGQSQKEPTINLAISVIDSLLIGTIEASLATPPTTPESGDAYRILENASGEWAGHDRQIALWIGGAWEYIFPSTGQVLFDKAAGVQLRYNQNWESAIEPTAPTGGTTADAEARTAITEIIEALRAAGLFANP